MILVEHAHRDGLSRTEELDDPFDMRHSTLLDNEAVRKEHGVTVLLVEQKLAFARRLATHFAILDRGRIVAGGPIAELTDELVNRHLKV